MMSYFGQCKTLEELKKEYHRLALANHPDAGGDLEVMKAINAEYDMAFEAVKMWHVNAKGERYQKDYDEQANEYKDIIDKLMKFKGLDIEIIGRFIWVSGNTKPIKDNLKAMDFRWHSQKSMWYKAPKGYVKRSRKTYTMEQVREMYGSKGTYRTEDELALPV